MGSFSIWHWIIVLAIVLLVFGAGKLPKVMGDLAKGIKNFKAGMQDGDDAPATSTASASATPLDHQPAAGLQAGAAVKKDETAHP